MSWSLGRTAQTLGALGAGFWAACGPLPNPNPSSSDDAGADAAPLWPPSQCAQAEENWPNPPEVATVTCPSGSVIDDVMFASYGVPAGACGEYLLYCNADSARSVVETACLGKPTCSIVASSDNFGGDPCPGSGKRLAIQVACGVSGAPSTGGASGAGGVSGVGGASGTGGAAGTIACAVANENWPNTPETAAITCPAGTVVTEVTFAGFGSSVGDCGGFQMMCSATTSRTVVKDACLGKNTCSVAASKDTFGEDPCPITPKQLFIQVGCSGDSVDAGP